jgi:hypothetical protein
MKAIREFLFIFSAIAIGGLIGWELPSYRAHAQNSAIASQTPYGLTFAKAYYAAQNPIKAPFYNQRYGGGTGAVLTLTQENTLVTQCAAAGVSIDEQIDYWGWDPLTVMAQRQMYGIPWVYPGLGAAVCVTTSQPGCVVTPGLFSGTPPVGAIMTSTLLTAYPPWPTTSTPTVIPTSIGPEISGPYFEVIGTVPPVGTKQGNCTLAQIPNFSMFGDGTMMNVWNCPTTAVNPH